jgi:uncharacterized protein YgiM (DUF1202 family)
MPIISFYNSAINHSLRAIISTFLLLISISVCAEESEKRMAFSVIVNDAYLDIRTGHGIAYPVFYVAQRDEVLSITKRRAHWYKVHLKTNGSRTVSGWIHQDDLMNTTVYLSETKTEDHPYFKRKFNPNLKAGYAVGRLEESDLINISLTHTGLDVIQLELRGSYYIGADEEGWFVNGLVSYMPFTNWRVAPYISSGYGYLRRESVLIKQQDESDHFFPLVLGTEIRISQQYHLRLEYQNLNTLTSSEQNVELEAWTLGFGAEF